MSRARLLRTSSFRLTLIYVGLFGVAVIGLFTVVNRTASSFMAGELDRAIAAELSDLEDEVRIGGANRLAAAITERLSTGAGSTLYLLQDEKGERLAGNLQPMRPVAGWFDVEARRGRGEVPALHRIHARGVRLPDGDYLAVGEDAYQLDRTRSIVVEAFAWSGATTFGLALATGMLMSAGVLHRVGAVARTSQAIMAGDLSRRIPNRGTEDEFDQLADVLNAMLARMQALLAGLKQVTDDVAHDLRRPLARLRLRFEAIRQTDPSLADYEQLVDRSIADMDAILDIFAAMLRIAEIEAADLAGRAGTVDLSAVLETVVEVYEPAAAERAHGLATSVAPALAVRGDRDLLTQLFANLVQNAIAHTPGGTSITVEAAAGPDGVEVVVADNGPGIPADERDKVFERFYRLERSRGEPGSGLGLSLVAAIARLHGAEIVLADNCPGLRVRLRFSELPVPAAAPDEPDREASLMSRQGAG